MAYPHRCNVYLLELTAISFQFFLRCDGAPFLNTAAGAELP
jgi:hypothetical protein